MQVHFHSIYFKTSQSLLRFIFFLDFIWIRRLGRLNDWYFIWMKRWSRSISWRMRRHIEWSRINLDLLLLLIYLSFVQVNISLARSFIERCLNQFQRKTAYNGRKTIFLSCSLSLLPPSPPEKKTFFFSALTLSLSH